MKAALLHEAATPLTVEEIDIIDPRPNEVRVNTAVSGVCHSDLHFASGSWNPRMLGRGPWVLGHEAAGTVEAVGDQVTYVQPGDHVIMSFKPFCGTCKHCTSGRANLCASPSVYGPTRGRLSWDGKPVSMMSSVGSFAEQMVTVESGVLKIPDDMPWAEAALVGCGVMTGVGAALYTAQVPGGATVVVIGCGGVGLNVIQGCRIAGAAHIIAVDMLDSKLELAKSFGATDVVNASQRDPVEAVKEMTGDTVEYAFEVIGRGDTSRQAFDMVEAGGTAVVVGMVADDITVPGPAFLSEKRLIGCMYGSTRFREHMPKLMDLYRQGRLDLSALVTERMPLEDVNVAFEKMKTGEVARSVLEIGV
ncbi:MAG: Zn-dependent alcohol dehydrogenase [Chloroflexi bacterium]|nr:Zn-dependent alcohol dehydrogenase [Chloroflexota bacterium]